jgi:ribosome modulation factor
MTGTIIAAASDPVLETTNTSFLAGVTARLLGWSFDDCPYGSDAQLLAQEWQEGWLSMGVRPFD